MSDKRNKDDELYMKLMEDDEIDGHKCRFKSNNRERYCNATSHESCDGCRFFVPTSHAKLELFTKKIEYLTGMMSRIIDENKRLQESVTIEKMNNKYLRSENEFLEKKNERLERLARKRRE